MPSVLRVYAKPSLLGVALISLFILYPVYLKMYHTNTARPITKKLAVQSPHTIEFEGALLSDTSSIALINKQTMQVGEEIYGLRIMAIREDSLDLQGPNGLIRLKLGSTYTA